MCVNWLISLKQFFGSWVSLRGVCSSKLLMPWHEDVIMNWRSSDLPQKNLIPGRKADNEGYRGSSKISFKSLSYNGSLD